MATNLDLAPPPVTFGAKTAVPIDISAIDAHLTFNGASQSAQGDATLSFVVGPTMGRPIFDLRQTITAVWLDGAPISLNQVLTQDLGGGAGAELKVLDVNCTAGSSHTLRLTYNVGLPASPPGGSYPPGLAWSAGPRLTFNFGFTDLAAARYLEAWIPANLIWDQFALTLEITVAGTAIAHRVITNGTVAALGANHWKVTFPNRFTALSHLLEVRAQDTLASSTANVTLPVSGQVVTVEVIKLISNPTINLSTQLTNLTTWLTQNENSVGPYLHGNRFTAFLIQGGMEYEGGCTSGVGSLRHETFHSWWGRGAKPASQADGWWDEAWNVYHDNGGTGVLPFDFNENPVTLSPINGYSRITQGAAYSLGERFFRGVSALTSPSSLTGWMGEFYKSHLDRPATTLDLEAHLVARSGQHTLVDAFHRWVYGFADPSPAPNVWLRDAPTHTGTETWNGRFWDSPDLWIRNKDDAGTTHQSPIAGRDNWFYARVRNRGTGTARHFLITFHVKQFAGLQFSWPSDFLPGITAAGGFDLGPGEDRVVKARWPASSVPPAGTHVCWLAAVLSRSDKPPLGAHVWEHGNLAQKNLAVVRLKRLRPFMLPFVVVGRKAGEERVLELIRPNALVKTEAALIPRFADPLPPLLDISDAIESGRLRSQSSEALDSSDPQSLLNSGFDADNRQLFPSGTTSRLLIRLPLGQATLGLELKVDGSIPAGTRGTIDLINRDASGRIVGGIAFGISVED